MKYTIIIGSNARKEIRRLSADIIVRINEKLKEFSETFEIQTPVPLGGNLKGLFKLRVGDYRIVYKYDRSKRIIIVVSVKHRSAVYRVLRP